MNAGNPAADGAEVASVVALPTSRKAIPRCGAKNRSGGACGLPAGWGTPNGPAAGRPGTGRCRKHGGATPNGQLAAVREAAQLEAVRLGQPINRHPHEILLGAAQVAAGVADYLQRRVLQLQDAAVMVDGDLHAAVRALIGALDQSSRLAKMTLDAGVDERRPRSSSARPA